MKNEKLSVSGLKEFSKSLQHYLDYKNRKKEQTDAMRFGVALHTAVLEPEKFEKEVNILTTEVNKRTKEGKELAKDLENTIYVTPSELETIKSMHTSIFTHPIASQLISKSKQKEIWLKGQMDSKHGKVDIHGKADCVNVGKRNVCIDLKTIADATIDKIEYSIKEYNYHWQALFYREMLKQEHGEDFEVFFIFVDKTERHNIQVVELDEYWYEVAAEEIAPLLDDFYKYLAEGEENLYKGYSNTIKTIKCPGWLKNRSYNSRFHGPHNNYSEPIVQFNIGGQKYDSNDEPKISDNEAENVSPEKNTEVQPEVVKSDVYEPESSAEVVAAVCEEKVEIPAFVKQEPKDDIQAILLVECEKLDGYNSSEKALQCVIDKVCGPGTLPESLDFPQKQKVLDEIQKMQRSQARKKEKSKTKKLQSETESVMDGLDF